MVRAVFDRQFKKWPTPTELAAIYDEPDLAASSSLRPAVSRLYLCRCHAHQALETGALLGEPGETEPDAAVFAVLVEKDWRCAGHPLALLPRRIDGVEVTPDNLAEVTRASLRGELSAHAAEVDRPPGAWAARLYLRLAQTPWQAEVVATVLDSMTDPSAEARAAALNCLTSLGLPEASQRALLLLQGDRTLFAGVPDKTLGGFKPPTLEHKLWRLALPLFDHAGPARELAQKDALTPGRWTETTYVALAKTEPEWVAAHLDGLLRANPDATDVLLRAIQQVTSQPADAADAAQVRAGGHLLDALLQWVRSRVQQPGQGSKDLYALLASRDRSWLAAHLDELLRANPAQLELLVETLDRHFHDPDTAAQKRLHEQLTQHVRERLLSAGPCSAALYTRIARSDLQWFLANLDELIAANPTELMRILQAIRDRVPDVALGLAQKWQKTPGKWHGDLYRLLVRDHPQWFAAHAEALARQSPDGIPALIRAINDFPSRIPNWQALRDALKAQAGSR